METPPDWARESIESSDHLDKMLVFASSNYAKQTDWFLHHRDTGIRHLGLVLAAQTSIAGACLYTPPLISKWLGIATILFLGFTGPFLAISAIKSAKRSYKAAIEYAVLATKSLWALGLMGIINVEQKCFESSITPAMKDPYFYVKRHVTNHCLPKGESTDQIVEGVLKDTGNTFYWTWQILVLFGGGVFSLGFVGAYAIFIK